MEGEIEIGIHISPNKHARSEETEAEAEAMHEAPLKKMRGEVTEVTRKLLRNRYKNESKGPFEIHFEKTDDGPVEGFTNPSDIKFGKALAKKFPELWRTVYNLRSLDMNKFTVFRTHMLQITELIK
ncbi:hypothetical protein EAI_10123 [Harpegnathos saltator]|uniref:Uncharacterized protein n=1 Tax=Harpegnathos saltator TaxID=610380 RepID=E2BYJ3_HARSA|nr:hypothetical protein EAI_10123 [Harpegnathos saltator]